MPQRKHRLIRLAGKALFFALLGWAVALTRAVRPNQGWDEWADADDDWTPAPPVVEGDEHDDQPEPARRTFVPRRVATSVAFVVVFFAAATFTAGAGDLVAKALDPARCAALMQTTGEDESVCAELGQESEAQLPPEAQEPLPEFAPEPALESTPSESAPAESLPGDASPEASLPAAESESIEAELAEIEAQLDDAALADPLAAPDADAAAAAEPADDYVFEAEAPEPARSSSRHWVVRRAKESKAHALPVEPEGGAATVWLNRALPDPTPPAKRLSPRFAKDLQRISAVNGVNWALVLGVLRAEGARDRVPATVRELNALASGLRDRGAADNEWNAVLSLSGRTGFADRAVSLARYNRAVGLDALVNGLEAEKAKLVETLLSDERTTVYAGGRDDLRLGRIDVRVVVLLRYLTESYGEVTISSLFSGHRKYARPGVVSAHTYGHAVDIATVGGVSMIGHQQPGSITEKAVRSILMLPVEVQPRQVISLLGMGGPSFPMANHDDHIHVGY